MKGIADGTIEATEEEKPINRKYQIGDIVSFFQGGLYHYGIISNFQVRKLEETNEIKMFYLLENGYCFYTAREIDIKNVLVSKDQSGNG